MGGTLTALIGSYAPVAGAFESIATVTASGGQTSLSFTSIPSTYTSLQIRGIARGNTNQGVAMTEELTLGVNGITSSVYSRHWISGNGISADSNAGASQTSMFVGQVIPSNDNTAGLFGAAIIDIHDYASTTRNKTIRSFGGADLNTGNSYSRMFLSSSAYQQTTAISSITLTIGASGFAAGTTFALYGIKGA